MNTKEVKNEKEDLIRSKAKEILSIFKKDGTDPDIGRAALKRILEVMDSPESIAYEEKMRKEIKKRNQKIKEFI